jgi:phage tail sheath protein FI
MPVQPTYPGVYIEEIPSGVRTIVGVATSITAFIGRAKRGPVDDPVTINGFADFERIFGGLWNESRLGFAVRDFFLNGGGQAVIVRLFHPTSGSEAKAAADAVADEAKTAAGGDPNLVLDDAKVTEIKNKAKAKADEYNAKPDAEKVAAQAALTIVNTVAKKDVKVSEMIKAIDDEIGNKFPASKATLTLGSSNKLKLEAAYEGTWGNELRARVDYDRPKELADSFTAFGLTMNDLFNLTVRDMKGGATEVFRNLTVKPGPRTVDKVLENESKLIRKVSMSGDIPEETDPADVNKNIIPFSKDDANLRSVGVTEQATDGSHPEQADFTDNGKEAGKKGLYALERLFARSGLFNLLCIPPYKFDDPKGDVDQDLMAKAAAYCEKRRAMLIVDPPSSWNDKAGAIEGFTSDAFPGIRSKNAAIFFPRLTQPNPLRDNQMEDFVPSGAVAGIFARTDVNRGVWKAPAGLDATLAGVSKLSVPMTDAENGELNPHGINCLRAFPAAGKVVWGSRTLRGADQLADEWKYIPVRRTALFIEESLYRGTQWVVFEPNDEPLWAQIRLNVGAFMHNMFRQGAFQGRTPQEAYFVKCDKETTPQNDINLGIVNIVVGFAPLKPAEFVIIKLQQMAGQIEV